VGGGKDLGYLFVPRHHLDRYSGSREHRSLKRHSADMVRAVPIPVTMLLAHCHRHGTALDGRMFLGTCCGLSYIFWPLMTIVSWASPVTPSMNERRRTGWAASPTAATLPGTPVADIILQ
jgi:hypothetical protein